MPCGNFGGKTNPVGRSKILQVGRAAGVLGYGYDGIRLRTL